MLLMHVGIQFQLGLNGIQFRGLGLKVVSDEIAFGQLFAAIREGLFAEMIDLFEGDAFEFEFVAELGDQCIDSVLFTFGVEDDETFVFTLHVDSGGLGTADTVGSWPGGGIGRAGLGRGGSAVLN